MEKKRNNKPLLIRLALWFNVVAIGLYASSVAAGYINPSSFAFFSIFGLLYPFHLILNILFIILWLVIKPKYALPSALFILLSIPTLSHNFQVFSVSPDVEEQSAIKIIGYNVQRFGLDLSNSNEVYLNKQHITDFLKKQEGDIVCLQEFHGKGRTLYEPLTKMKEALGSQSYYYESYFNPRWEQITGLAIFTKYKAINRGILKISGSRTFGIFIDVLIRGDTVRVYNIHLASIQLTPSDIDFVVAAGQDEKEFSYYVTKIYDKLTSAFQLREQQMTFLLDKIRNCPYPVILEGDFNDTPASYVYTRISELVIDAFVAKGKGFSITYAGQIPFLRIDYIMHSDDFKTMTYAREKLDYSDHYPIISVIEKIEKD